MPKGTPRELRAVERARVRHERARAELELAIQQASAAGHPLRPIAAAAGLSVEWTRRTIMKAA